MSKLSKTDIKEILLMRVDGYTYEEIGKKYGVSKQRVQQLIKEVVDIPVERKSKKYKYSNFYLRIVQQYGSISDFTKQIGVKPTSIYTWLSGKLPENIRILIKVCKALDADIGYLFAEEMAGDSDG